VKSSQKWFLRLRFVGEGNVRDLGYAFLNGTYFRPCNRFSLSSVQRARGIPGEKKKEEERKKERERERERKKERKKNPGKI